MRSVEEQQALVMAAAVAPRPVRVAITEAQGLLCAEEITADKAMPAFDQAAIDGYAVRSVDVSSASGGPRPAGSPSDVILPVVGDIAAGSRQPKRLQPRQAVRIETGAPMPTLADAVLPLEFSDEGRTRVRVYQSVRSGDFVKRTGDDVRRGDVAVRPGQLIGAAQVGLLAALGKDKVLVHPRPRLSIISVGEELVDIGRTPGPGQVYDINSYALAAAARDAGAEVNRVGIVAGDARALRDVVEGQLIRSELVIISGALGGSSGAKLIEAVGELGKMEIARVAMQPGSIQGFGQLGRDDVPTFLLPSNPVSALIIFEVIIRPLIRAALGRQQSGRRIVKARTVAAMASVPDRTGYQRAQLLRDESNGEFIVKPLTGGHNGSPYLLTTLAEANCLVVMGPDVVEVPQGDLVEVSFLAQRA
ncbi:MAG: molybdopterin molybdotransferase MoeA [Nocardiaceae bacterium]|nr:molybdopterin molybdotransferase MoeA [Nocardiaceae bacterium]